jgi:hypothetical protein
MSMARVKTSRKKARRLSKREVIDRIMQVIEALPEALQGLPAHMKTRKHWEKTFSPGNNRAAAMLEVLEELPAFTDQAPTKSTRAAWLKLFTPKYLGPEQVLCLLRDVEAIANFKPIKRPPIKVWREAFGKDEVLQRVRPKESFDYIPNPHRGTTTFQRFQGDALCPTIQWGDRDGPTEFGCADRIRDNVKFIPRATLAYCRWPWSWLEPQKGGYNWEIIDHTLKTARERGQTAQLRFQPYTTAVDTRVNPPKAKRFPPEVSVDVPDWYWETGAAWIDQGPFGRNEPDCNDPRYLEHFGDFIRAFGARYDGHRDLESIDIAYAGFWGEAGGNTTADTAARLADIYLEAFRKTQLLGMLGTPGYRRAAAVTANTGTSVGWRADSFGDYHLGNSPDAPANCSWNHMYDAYVQGIYECRAEEIWKTAPVTMETSAAVPHWVASGYDIDQIISEGYKYHMSVFMPKSVFFPEKVMDKLVEFDKKIGYRFVLRHMLLPLNAQPGKPVSIDMFVDNVGCAPIYRRYRLALRFLQGKNSYVVRFNEDIRKWLPGHVFLREALTVPQELQTGEVKVALGIVDDTDKPRVWFAIQGKTDAGWHPLTSMDVVR